jgi:hypothetical protein
MYPYQEEAMFDLEYYWNNHMKQVEKLLKPYGLVKTTLGQGMSGGADLPPPYVCVGCLFFETADGYDGGTAGAGRVLGLAQGNELNVKSVLPPLTEAFHLAVPLCFSC